MRNYADYISEDPFRRGLRFPAIEEVLGDLNSKRILDIGCGDGLFPRLLAPRRSSDMTGRLKRSQRRGVTKTHDGWRSSLLSPRRTPSPRKARSMRRGRSWCCNMRRQLKS